MYVKTQYFRNAGLGNKLFPWARAIVIVEKYNYTFIDPVWFSPRGASVTRGGIDYKKALHKIWLFNTLKKRKQDISFLQGFFLNKNTFRWCDDLHQAFDVIDHRPANIIFRWNTHHNFTDIAPYRHLINAALIDITKEKSIAFSKGFYNTDFIGLNIRTGKDFIKAGSGKKGYFLTDIDWFIHALKITRAKAGELPAIIVSDGGNKELAKILKEPGTTLLNSRNAMEDLLVLSKSKVLLGSGNSSFSAWASFLGAMDTFSSSETPFTNFKINSERSEQVIGTL